MADLRRDAPDAARAIVAALSVQPALRVPLSETVGHFLAEDVLAAIPLPPWTNAGMDGYAVRSADVRGASPSAPITLRVVGSIAAGEIAATAIAAGEASRIFTGAPVPDGADSVVRQEDTDLGRERVTITSDRDAGRNVRRAGGDLATGALALPAGTGIGPRQVALLAALGVTHPVVHRRPRVGVLVTGDEIAPLSESEAIRNRERLADANGPGLAAMVAAAGGIAIPLGIVRDDAEAVRQAVEEARDVDLLITAGGVSVGAHDHLHAVMASLGVRLIFRRVRMRPGGPAAAGILADGRLWLGLPGNPVSTAVTFELFARPAIRALMGDPHPYREVERFTLAEPMSRDATLDLYVRVTIERSHADHPAHVRLTGHQGSGMLSSVARSDALVILPAGAGDLPAGTGVDGWRW